MSPSPIKRLAPYFKTRPRDARSGAPPPAGQPAAAPPAAAPPAQAPAQSAAPPQPVQAALAPPPAADLVARRQQLAQRYAELESDLGGLVYEMAIRDHFRLDVVVRRAAELQAVDAELSSVEKALGIATQAATAVCPSCRAPVAVGAQYCGVCGSTLTRTGVPSTPVSANATVPPGSGVSQ